MGLKASWNRSYLNQDKKTRRLCMAPTLPATEVLSVGGPSLPPPAPEGWPAPYFLFALAPCLWVQTRRTNPARCPLPPSSPQHGQAGRPCILLRCLWGHWYPGSKSPHFHVTLGHHLTSPSLKLCVFTVDLGATCQGDRSIRGKESLHIMALQLCRQLGVVSP